MATGGERSGWSITVCLPVSMTCPVHTEQATFAFQIVTDFCHFIAFNIQKYDLGNRRRAWLKSHGKAFM